MSVRALASLVLFTLAGCGGNVQSPSELMGGRWRLVSLRVGTGASQSTDPGRYTADFGEGGRLSARADCNTCTGGYSVSAGSLTVTALACTRVACPADSLEQPYVELLSGTSTAHLDGNELELTSARGTLAFSR